MGRKRRKCEGALLNNEARREEKGSEGEVRQLEVKREQSYIKSE